ncbi:MAG: DUF4442 domain-containing protein [Parachlamydiales bacterium]|jgi:acyl-coenzyme A thioesterase PaaI-like protein
MKAMKIKRKFIRFWNMWPPFLFSGIKIMHMSPDFREIRVKLKLRWWNANFVGTQYGGLLYSLADPFYMIMLLENLGPEYIVWDKTATIKFIKPGRTDVKANFVLEEADLEMVKKEVSEFGKTLFNKDIKILDLNNELIAVVSKTIYIKKKGD